MKIFNTIIETKEYLKSQFPKTIGFVPTMGALHTGHIDLVKRAKNENEITVCSIFVNPTQFNNSDDLKKYPRTLENDAQLLESAGCDVVFAPTVEEMYDVLPKLKFNFGKLEEIMEGACRPGHFNGVGIVVSKLFNIIKPTKAYFGQKDLQQVAVVNLIIKDLSFDLEIIVCDTIRESDGLAMSSRNRRLSPEARILSPKIYASLLLGKKSILEGKSISETKSLVAEFYKQNPEFTLEYYEIVDFETLENLTEYIATKKTALVIAVFLNDVRLIDNIVF